MSGFTPLDGNRLGDRVAADIRRAILTGELRPGERLLEQEIAEAAVRDHILGPLSKYVPIPLWGSVTGARGARPCPGATRACAG